MPKSARTNAAWSVYVCACWLALAAGCGGGSKPANGGDATHAPAANAGSAPASAGSQAKPSAGAQSPSAGASGGAAARAAMNVAAADGGRQSAHDETPPPSASPTSWLGYGYDAYNTGTNLTETTLSAANVSMLSERWRVQIPAGATSTPVVDAGSVYFGGWDGNAYAVDAQTGEIRWQVSLTDLLIRSTPLIVDDRVFVAAGLSLFALKRSDGSTIFEAKLSDHPETVLDSSPKLVDGLVIIGVSSVENTFTKDHYTSQGAIVAIDAISGNEVWRFATTGDGPGPCMGGAGTSVWSSAAFDEDLGLMYIGTGQGHQEPASNCSDSLLALYYGRDHGGERLAWGAQFTSGDVYAVSPMTAASGLDADVGASPNLFEVAGRPVVGVGDKQGRYRVFDRRTGDMVWKRDDLGVGDFHQAGGVRTTAAVHDGTIYVASNTLGFLSLVGSSVTGGLDPNDGANLYALDAATGDTRWTMKLPNTIDGSFVLANGVLYHAANGGGLYARDPATGQELWHAPLTEQLGAGPSIVNGRLYLSAGYDWRSSSTATPTSQGGFVVSYGIDDAPPQVWMAHVDPPKPFTEPECEMAVDSASDWPNGGRPSAECASCLCQCDATSAGNCDTCWLQAPCAVANCSLSAPGDDMQACMSLLCVSKLLPSYVFLRSVQTAPCAIRCATQCGF